MRDKLIFAAIMANLGFPALRVVAFLHPMRSSFIATGLRDKALLTAFLRGL